MELFIREVIYVIKRERKERYKSSHSGLVLRIIVYTRSLSNTPFPISPLIYTSYCDIITCLSGRIEKDACLG